MPDLFGHPIRAKIDTGASVSSLHAYNPHLVSFKGHDCVEFETSHAVRAQRIHCVAPLARKSAVKSSNGDVEDRFVIYTKLNLASHMADIEVTLSDRSAMQFPLLIGRQALRGRWLIDPYAEYMLGTGPEA